MFLIPCLPDGVHSNSPCLSVCLSLDISRDRLLAFSETLHEVGVDKLKKVTRTELWNKNLKQGIRGIKHQILGSLDIFSETGH